METYRPELGLEPLDRTRQSESRRIIISTRMMVKTTSFDCETRAPWRSLSSSSVKSNNPFFLLNRQKKCLLIIKTTINWFANRVSAKKKQILFSPSLISSRVLVRTNFFLLRFGTFKNIKEKQSVVKRKKDLKYSHHLEGETQNILRKTSKNNWMDTHTHTGKIQSTFLGFFFSVVFGPFLKQQKLRAFRREKDES